MNESLRTAIADSSIADLSVEELQERYNKSISDLNDKLAEMQSDVELIYQLKRNELDQYYTALINKKLEIANS